MMWGAAYAALGDRYGGDTGSPPPGSNRRPPRRPQNPPALSPDVAPERSPDIPPAASPDVPPAPETKRAPAEKLNPKELPVWVSAVELQAPPETGADIIEISLDKSVYKRGTTITVTASNVTPEMAAANAALVMAERGRTEMNESIAFENLKEGLSVISFDVPARAADFEFRLFRGSAGWSEKSLVKTVPFKVSDAPTEDEMVGVSVAPDKDTYKWGVRISVTVDGVSREMADMKASLVLAETGQTEINEWISFQEVKGEGSNVLTFDAPRRDGDYEFRLFTRGSPWKRDALMKVVPFKVSDSATKEELASVSVTPDKETYKQGMPITVAVDGISPEMAEHEATLTLAETGLTEVYEWISYKTIPAAGMNKISFDAPKANGNYEFRLYPRNSHWTSKTLMNTARFSVSNAPDASEREAVSMTLDHRAYAPGTPMRITVENVSGEMANLRAAVTLAKKSEMGLHESLASGKLESEGRNVVEWNAPAERGQYEVRLFTRTAPLNRDSLVMRIPFAVGDAENPEPVTGRYGDFEEGEGWEFAAGLRNDWD
ncbi:MAG: hypothetical protein LBU26_03265 [Synergistaceae bacterium]|nr:hypothetical protein [Synergistaceae bacterium]